MSNVAEILKSQDPRGLERRRNQYFRDMQYFSAMMYDVISRMPTKFIVHQDGHFEHLIEPQWQKKIDFVLQQRDEYVKENYSDLTTNNN